MSDKAGPETKPVLLYYGLNQAARALVAAATRPGRPFEVSGHGIKVSNLDDIDHLADLRVVDAPRKNDKSSFLTLARSISSPALRKDGATVGELWGTLPEACAVPLSMRPKYEVIRVGTVASGKKAGRYTGSLVIRGRLRELNVDEGLSYAQRLDLLYRIYPGLHSVQPRQAPGSTRFGGLISSKSGQYYTISDVVLPNGRIHTVDDLYRRGHRLYRDSKGRSTIVLPAVCGNTRALDPIIGWWSVLFALSMLARYRPGAWSSMLDVDTSADAVSIEHLMRQAHKSCVNLTAWHMRNCDLS